jgi:hypothetical protein
LSWVEIESFLQDRRDAGDYGRGSFMNETTKELAREFPISNDEYQELEKSFGLLAKKASWQLLKKNSKNNHTDDFDDINQELSASLIIAGSYYKRQTYIEECLVKSAECLGGFDLLKFIIDNSKPNSYIKQQAKEALKRTSKKKTAKNNDFVILVLKELVILWQNRTRHGANRRKFGKPQECFLEKIVKKSIPKKLRPFKSQPLKLDNRFHPYCKSIIWNSQKGLGKKITKEKVIRGSCVSLSEFDYMASDGI